MSVLWTAAQRRQVFEEHLRDDARGLTQLAFCLCRDRTKAEDITAEAFARVWVRWQEGKVEDLRPYSRRTVVNLCKKSWRRELVARRYQSQLEAVLPNQTDMGDLDLVDAVLRLPAPQRAVIVLRYFEELSEKSVAELLGVSPGTVKSRTSRALASLRLVYGEKQDA
jgi:RNA polymerase sigma-70 factor (sigma-E family)